MTAEWVWIVTEGGGFGTAKIAFRSSESAKAACEAFTDRFGGTVVEDWSDISAKSDGALLVRYIDSGWGKDRPPEEQRIERYVVDGA